jgi:mannose-6-phosphate isomerase class I
VLCESLTYNTGLPEVLPGAAIHDHVTAFRPPFEEFEIQRMEVPAGERVALPTNQGPLLLLVHAGAGSGQATGGEVQDAALQKQLELHRGSVVFVPAGTSLTLSASATGPLTVWAAAVNASVFAAPAPAPASEEEPVPAAAAAVEEPALVAA